MAEIEKEALATDQETPPTREYTVTFCCLPLPCCLGPFRIDADKLKLIGAVCTGLALFFSIIVVGVISDELHVQQEQGGAYCYFGGSNSNCGFGIFCGSLSIILCIVLGALYFLRFKPIVTHEFLGTAPQFLAEAIASGVMTLLFLICAFVLANSDRSVASRANKRDAANAAVTFSFFATTIWSLLSYIPFMNYRMLPDEASSGSGTTSNPSAPV
ncbi:synaptogyrin-1-like [Sycon ciliatum]|uniref:synaptogyrin-1-like n=1 Tax=Sycon ciliatum TaxID=27933 RepID=UPI0020AA4B5D